MTFSEYFNGLYRPLKNEEKKADFFDQMISHFIDEDACEGCTLLHVDSETKPRYAREKKPNPIKADNAKYLYARRNYNRYTTWVENLLEVMDAYEVVESWLTKSGIEFEDASDACYKLLADIFYNIGFPKSNEEAIILPQKEKDSDIAESKWTEHDNALVAEFNSDYDEVMQMCIGDRYAQEYLTGRLSKKVNTLYNSKWKDKSAEFEDILLRSDILAVLGTLQELCDALNPNKGTKPGLSVRMIRTKLRNLYIKLHPTGYIGIYPHEAFIDDWNDGEYY